jgi:hypothetical protein
MAIFPELGNAASDSIRRVILDDLSRTLYHGVRFNTDDTRHQSNLFTLADISNFVIGL